MTIAMLATGAELVAWDHVMESGKLQFMLNVLGSASFTAFYLFFGMLRAIALWLNGAGKPWTAYVRALCAVSGAVAWFHMAASLIIYQSISSLPPAMTVPVLVTLIAMETDSFLRALDDARNR